MVSDLISIGFIERLLSEDIQFTFSRSYSSVAKSRIFRNFYRQIAEEASPNLN